MTVPRWLAEARLVRACAASVCLAAAPWAQGAEDTARELAGIVERLNALDTWLDAAGKRLADQQRTLAAADRGIADNATRVRDLDTRIVAARNRIEQLRSEQERLAQSRDEARRHVAAHLRDAWRLSAQDTLKLMLNAEDPAAFERMGRYHAYFAKARSEVVDRLREALAAVRENQEQLAEQQRTLETSRRALDDKHRTLAADRAARTREIATLRSDLAAKNTEHERLLTSRQRLESLIAELGRTPRQRIARSEGLGFGTKGDLPWPVQGRVEHRFGDARTGARTRWQGVYFRAPLGSPVRSVAPGRVAFADWLRGFGLLAIVDHGDHQMSLYGATDVLYVRPGEWVERGDTIASVGQSGGQPDVGLYFEIRQRGEPTDPLKWLTPQPSVRPVRP